MASRLRIGLVGHMPFRDWPGVPTFDTLADLLRSGVQAVAVTTPPET